MHIQSNAEETLFLSRLEDLVARSQRDFAPYTTMFLNEMQCAAAAQFLKWQADVSFFFGGGYEQAERKCCCIYPSFLEADAAWMPFRCITIQYPAMQTLTHRDFLGAILSCGIKRETIGDILIENGKCQLWALDTVASLIVQTLYKVGNVGVHCNDTEPFSVVPIKKRIAHHGTVASLRCDAIAAMATRQSREKIAKLIQQGNMERSGHTVSDPSEHMQEGDIFVIRGSGKFQLVSVSGLSKKGRMHILIEQYK